MEEGITTLGNLSGAEAIVCLSVLTMGGKIYLPLLEALECSLDWKCCLRRELANHESRGPDLPVFVFLGAENGFKFLSCEKEECVRP